MKKSKNTCDYSNKFKTNFNKSTYKKQKWLKLNNANESWWPWGLIPLLGFLFLVFYSIAYVAPNVVESQVYRTTKAKLDNLGLSWIDVAIDGQNLTLSGTAPDEATIYKALNETKNTTCSTWLGKLLCPIVVTNAMAVETAVPKARFHDVTSSKSLNGDLTITGEVPTKKIKNDILSFAKKIVSKDQIIDKLKVTTDPATIGYIPAITRGIELVARLGYGEANWTSGVFTISGETNKSLKTEIENAAKQEKDGIKIGKVKIIAKTKIDDCNNAFKKILKTSSINFKSASSDITESSFPVLYKLSEVAKRCKGKIKISGHTDNLGEPEPNKALSLSRANSVKSTLLKLGILKTRLTTEGFGDSKPIADNKTPAGQAKNRRIEIKIIK